MPSQPPTYWFPAKRFGWGWGPPKTWQGWAVLIVFFVLMAGGAILLLPRQVPRFMMWTLFLLAILMAICWVKGERPRWRWGDKDR